ncbi:MAG TPA: hypothetical protein VNH83_20850, partial [Bryobacteraceae bacterium]|nr:hypothetical protein [Bryobacteraceae bacterium]
DSGGTWREMGCGSIEFVDCVNNTQTITWSVKEASISEVTINGRVFSNKPGSMYDTAICSKVQCDLKTCP